MKKLFSILTVFAFVLTGGILLAACGGPSKYAVHFPDNLEEYGVESIYADVDSDGNCVVSKDSKNIYFRFMARYDYNPDTLTVHFKNSAGQDVAVSNFEFDSYNDGELKKTYHVTLQKAEEVTITLDGKAKMETKTFQIDTENPYDRNGSLLEDNLNKLMLNIEINGKSTGDMNFNEFKTMITSETETNDNKLILKESQEFDYGTQIKVSIWGTEHMNLFREALDFYLNNEQNEYGDAYPSWERVIVEQDSKKLLKNTAIFTLEDDLRMGFSLNNLHFEEAKFDTDNSHILCTGFLYFGEGGSASFKIYDGEVKEENEITTLADLLSKEKVTLKLNSTSQVEYIAKNVKENKFNTFRISSNGRSLSNFIVKGEEDGAEDSKTYNLIFENVSVVSTNGSKLFVTPLANDRVELFKIFWQDFQKAMNEDFVKLPLDCEYDYETIWQYCNGQGSNVGNISFSGTGSELQYVYKDQEVEYNFGFMTTDYINENRISALGKTFKISIGNESQTITVTNSGDVETYEYEFSGGKITLTFNPQDYGGEEGKTVPRLRATGKAQAFASAGSVLKIEFVE